MSTIELLPRVTTFLASDLGSFIDGQYQADPNALRTPVTNPATGQVIASVRCSSSEQVDAAVQSSGRALKGAWAQTSPYQRGVILNRFADLIEANAEELAQIETLCSGKVITLSRGLEIAQTVLFIRYFAGWATKINGETASPSIPSFNGEQYTAFTRREPVGVVAGIVPWNFSVMIGIWKIASALVTGCTIVVKPSEFTPLTLLRVAELAVEAGLPAGAFNVVSGAGKVGQQLVAHPGIRKVTFTGSVPAGISVGTSAMQANLTRATLELGGKNAAAFLADFDEDRAVEGLIQTAFVHQGQVCASPERIFIHRSRIDSIAHKLCAALAQLKIGDPLDESTQFGPLANKPHFEKIRGIFDRAHQHNHVLCGARVLDRPGYFVEPTVIMANNAQDALLHEETFGPIICLLAFDTEEELVTLMNDSPFGLTASVWTNDLSKALRLIPQIEAGTVWVNMHTFLDPALPFGGVKASGLGREFGNAFIDDYTELKSVMIRY